MEEERTVSEQDIVKSCLKIAEIISQNDEHIISELSEGYANPQTYIEKHYERLSEEYMLFEDEMTDYVCNKWWLLTDILEVNGYVCTRDWKDELEDFLYFLSETKRAVSENIRLEELNLPFSENDDIPKWSELIDKELEGRDLVVGNIDTESDAYTVFFCTTTELKKLENYADAINHKIMSAKKIPDEN